MKIVFCLFVGVLLFSFTSNAQFIDGDKSVDYQVYEVSGVNSKKSEFSPVMYGDVLIFTSDREYNFNNVGEASWKKNGFLNLYEAKQSNIISDSAEFEKPKVFSYQLLNDDHTGPICFTKDLNQAYFTQVSHKDRKLFGKTVKHPQLFRAEIVKDKWKVVEKLLFNNLSYSYGHPALSEDGNTLYYVSDEIGGTGGRDIYKVVKTENGWGEPVNLSDVNSSGNDMFPTIHKGVLYFASDRPGGLGGLDLHACKIEEFGFGEVQNLGANINSNLDDFAVVFQKGNENGFFSSNREGGEGEDDIYFFKSIEAIKVISQEISGQFEFKSLTGESPEGLEVLLIDDNGDIVFKTTTDENGHFKFKNLPTDGSYTIKMVGEDGKEMVLTLFGKDGDAALLANDEGEFVYRKLSGENINSLSLIEEEDIDLATNTATVSGQFIYQNLSFDDPGVLNVYLVDDEGNIVYRTKTDENGKFEFKNVNAADDYTVKLDENAPDLALLIYNKDNYVRSQLLADSKGNFLYKKLSADYGNNLNMLTEDEGNLTFPGLTMHVIGEFAYEDVDGADVSLVDYEIYDANMKLLYSGKSGEKGGFRLVNIPLTDELIFKIPENSPYFKENIKLNILKVSKDVVVVLDKDMDGYFRYKYIDSGNDGIDTIDPNEVGMSKSHNHEVPIIYYDNAKSSIGQNEYISLNEVAKLLKADEKLFVRVESHSSSTSTAAYNKVLSQKRMMRVRSYLISKGVDKTQIDGHYYGEEKIINKCVDEADCTDEEHRQNRRTEIKLYYK